MEFTLKTTIAATANEIYKAWLSSDGHTKMTGGEANISDKIGSKFTAWDGYIEGRTIELIPDQRIVQNWRTTEFEANEKDSRIEILLNEKNGQTELTLFHSDLSENSEHYKAGWENHYFAPMNAYFNNRTK